MWYILSQNYTTIITNARLSDFNLLQDHASSGIDHAPVIISITPPYSLQLHDLSHEFSILIHWEV